MATLNTTKYPNNSRTVSGNISAQVDDVTLLCDTTLGIVKVDLLEIPADRWLTTWRIYIVDSGNNASVNNITIAAPIGYTINGAASAVINVNGGIAVLTISSNTSYLASFSFSSSATIDGHIIQDEGVDLPQEPRLNFTGDLVTATDNAGVGTNVNIVIPDTGWTDLAGFTFITADLRPQYRVLGKVIYFRGIVVIPIESGGSVIPWVNSNSYAAETTVLPATLIADGVVLNSNGSLHFNLGSPVITNPLHRPSQSYSIPWTIGTQRRNSQAPVGASNVVFYTAPFRMSITNTGILTLQCLKDSEVGAAGQQIGQSNLRYLTANSIAGTTISDYRNIVDSAAGASTLIGRSNVGTANDAAFVGLNSQAATHAITHDAANEDEIAGYTIPINGLIAFID